MKQKIVQWSLYLLLIGMIAGMIFLSYDGNIGRMICCALFFLLSLAAIPALHEAGHYVFGKKEGFAFYSASVACFTVRVEDGKAQFSFTPTNEAGKCEMFPADETNIERRLFLFTLGGTLFNGAYVLAAGVILAIFRTPWLFASLGMTLPYAVYLLLLNLLPFENFDGFLLFGLPRKDPSARTIAHIFAFQGMLFHGETPSDGKEVLFGLPQLPEDDPAFALLQYLRYLCFLDMGASNEAFKAICRLEEEDVYIPREIERTIYSELAYAYSVLQPKQGLAENYLINALGFNNLLPEEEVAAPACKRAALAYASAFRNEGLYLAWRDRKTREEELKGLRFLEERLLEELLKDIDSFDEE